MFEAKMIKFACVGNLNGHLPEIPECDALIISGNISPVDDPVLCRYKYQKDEISGWFKSNFKPWVDEISKRASIFGIAGACDYIFQANAELVPEMNWTYLQDSSATFHGLKIYGTPWSQYLDLPEKTFAFDDYYLEKFRADRHRYRNALIPNDVDVLISFGVPSGFARRLGGERSSSDSQSLMDVVVRSRPRLVVCPARGLSGVAVESGVTFVSPSIRNERFVVANGPIVVSIEERSS